MSMFYDFASRVVQLGSTENKHDKRVKSKFTEFPYFSCSRSDGTLEPVTSSFPAASESPRTNSQSSVVVQPVTPLVRLFPPVRIQSGKARCHS